MNKAFAVVVGLLLLVLLVLFSTTYTVRFHEVAVKTTFGKEETVQTEPGVHFRYPLFVDRVRTYDKRVQLVETPLVETPTADGQSVMVRAFLMWRVDPENVLRFAQSYPDKMSDADRPLRDQLQTAVKGGVGRYTFDEIGFPELIQFLTSCRRNGCVHIKVGAQDGTLDLRDGEVKAAAWKHTSGDDAVFAMVEHDHGTFRFQPADDEVEANVTMPTMPLLIEAMRRRDERMLAVRGR